VRDRDAQGLARCGRRHPLTRAALAARGFIGVNAGTVAFRDRANQLPATSGFKSLPSSSNASICNVLALEVIACFCAASAP